MLDVAFFALPSGSYSFQTHRGKCCKIKKKNTYRTSSMRCNFQIKSNKTANNLRQRNEMNRDENSLCVCVCAKCLVSLNDAIVACIQMHLWSSVRISLTSSSFCTSDTRIFSHIYDDYFSIGALEIWYLASQWCRKRNSCPRNVNTICKPLVYYPIARTQQIFH